MTDSRLFIIYMTCLCNFLLSFIILMAVLFR